MAQENASTLRRRRKKLLRRLPDLEHMLRGSLIERYKPCGKPGCRCARGLGHGPKYYLSTSRAGYRPEMEYVPLSCVDAVTGYLQSYRQAKEILDEICRINAELLRRRELR